MLNRIIAADVVFRRALLLQIHLLAAAFFVSGKRIKNYY